MRDPVADQGKFICRVEVWNHDSLLPLALPQEVTTVLIQLPGLVDQ